MTVESSTDLDESRNIENLDETLSGEEDDMEKPPKSPSNSPENRSRSNSPPIKKTPKNASSDDDNNIGGTSSGCARAAYRHGEAISIDELDEQISTQGTANLGLGVSLPNLPPFPRLPYAANFPGMTLPPAAHRGGFQAAFPSGFYGSGVPLTPPVASMFTPTPPSTAPLRAAHLPGLVGKPPFRFRGGVTPRPTAVSSSTPFLNRSFAAPPSMSFSTPGVAKAGMVLKCPQCFLVLDSAAALATHMEIEHGRPTAESHDVARGVAGGCSSLNQAQCKNCGVFFSSTIELGRHIATQGC